MRRGAWTSSPWMQRGPFHLLIHKLYGDDWRAQLEAFAARHPAVPVVDPPHAIDRLHSRISMLQVVSELAARTGSGRRREEEGVADPVPWTRHGGDRRGARIRGADSWAGHLACLATRTAGSTGAVLAPFRDLAWLGREAGAPPRGPCSAAARPLGHRGSPRAAPSERRDGGEGGRDAGAGSEEGEGGRWRPAGSEGVGKK
ncbi:hypothetical protein C2845_PM01G05860 [Panicum miliaceum]|uniref:Inositol-tetrakisphosphate 1-kinase N-terminal domain-containing protein n=1 Tax=Panicum miliaceum TaxID=4540 RepID=A0A3L6TNF5_PANMI|nr:hypothetical protein C2845_PM01G05860 [Panicum miliaceum]